MRVLCVFGQHQYGDASRGIGTEYDAFIPALKRLGHVVHHFESWDRKRYRDFAELNEKLLIKVDAFKPEVMLTVQMGYEIWIETLEIIRAGGEVATVTWTTDDSWKYREVSRFIGPAYHAITTTYDYILPRYRADGIKNALLTQWAVPSDWLNAPLSYSQCRYRVSFVGTAHGDRKRTMEKLRKTGVDVACFGHGWPNGPVEMNAIPQIMRESVINLNFANSRGENQIKARNFEVPGAGGFLLTQHAPGIERYYHPGREIAVFHDFDTLVDSIRYFTAHPDERDAIAEAGFNRTRTEHTYDLRLAEVLKFALDAKKRASDAPTAPSFEIARNNHVLTPILKAITAYLTCLAGLIFGPVRGPRAARRLVFELSWRLVGRHTFTASGWPGRMFPHC